MSFFPATIKNLKVTKCVQQNAIQINGISKQVGNTIKKYYIRPTYTSFMSSLLHSRNQYQGKSRWLWAIGGFIILVLVWWILAESMSIERPIVDYDSELPSSINADGEENITIDRDSLFRVDSIKLANATEFETIYPLFPPPQQVLKAFPKLYEEDDLFTNTGISIWRNIQGYFWAVFFALLIGLPLALIPQVRALFSTQVDALRYLPLTALTQLFVLWLGIGESMKVSFLAFGILVYLLPVVVQRINEVEDVYLKTTFTLGASNWQMVKSVYLPAVLSKLMDDIRVLTAISWTYIIIAELLNRTGGVGDKIWLNSRFGNVDKAFAWLFVIIIVGFLQDRLFTYMDRRLFPHKYYKTVFGGLNEVRYGFSIILACIMLFLLAGAFIPAATASLQSLLYIIVITGMIMIVYGEIRFQRSYTT